MQWIPYEKIYAYKFYGRTGSGFNHTASLPTFNLKEQNRRRIFEDVKERLEKAGLIMHSGTVVEATIISAPSSTKNKEGKRDPEMHRTKKGSQWYHGMKVHAGVDAGSGYIHTTAGTAANVSDADETTKLIREDDEVGYGDSGYTGITKCEEVCNDEHLSKTELRINIRPSSLKTPKNYESINRDKQNH